VAAGAVLAVLGVLVRVPAPGRADVERRDDPGAAAGAIPRAAESSGDGGQGFLYGRVTGVDGATYTGRLRFGRDQEAFWGDDFNGSKVVNPWRRFVPDERVRQKRRPLEIFGFTITLGDRESNLTRPLMARFGDIATVEARGRDVQVTLKSGTLVHVDRFEASDFDDGLRVWDERRGVVDLPDGGIRRIELLPTARVDVPPERLHGTVHTAAGDFTGFVAWDRQQCLGSDDLVGRAVDGRRSVRFGAMRSIARASRTSARVTLLDGGELELSGSRAAGDENRGIYVDDRRYGRVLVTWDAFERVDFNPAGSGPAYTDFPAGRPLTGAVTTRTGRRFTGRLVFDLDESETTETLDAPSGGVNYMIPFGLVASIDRAAQRDRVTLHDGEELQLEHSGDLGESNGGMLIFADGAKRPEYVAWSDVQKVTFTAPAR
jgi:hypothetical protein